jgi:hypothetical protein
MVTFCAASVMANLLCLRSVRAASRTRQSRTSCRRRRTARPQARGAASRRLSPPDSAAGLGHGTAAMTSAVPRLWLTLWRTPAPSVTVQRSAACKWCGLRRKRQLRPVSRPPQSSALPPLRGVILWQESHQPSRRSMRTRLAQLQTAERTARKERSALAREGGSS